MKRYGFRDEKILKESLENLRIFLKVLFSFEFYDILIHEAAEAEEERKSWKLTIF